MGGRGVVFADATSKSPPFGKQGRLSRAKGAPEMGQPASFCLLGFLAEDYGELVFAGGGGVVEGVAGTVALGGFEEESALDAIGEAGESGFTVVVGADFQIEFAGVHESIGDVDFDLGGVDGGGRGVGDGEVYRAGADAAVDDRDCF